MAKRRGPMEESTKETMKVLVKSCFAEKYFVSMSDSSSGLKGGSMVFAFKASMFKSANQGSDKTSSTPPLEPSLAESFFCRSQQIMFLTSPEYSILYFALSGKMIFDC